MHRMMMVQNGIVKIVLTTNASLRVFRVPSQKEEIIRLVFHMFLLLRVKQVISIVF